MFTNEKRTRYYGLRIGDTVIDHATHPLFKNTATVIQLGGSNNNCVYAQSLDHPKPIKYVAELLTIIKKIDE